MLKGTVAGQNALFPEWDERRVEQARVNKQDAMQRAEAHADIKWQRSAYSAVKEIASHRAEFTADPVWELLKLWKVPPPREPRALGPVMLRAVKDGICEKTDRVAPSVLPQRNMRPIAIYRSRLYKSRTR